MPTKRGAACGISCSTLAPIRLHRKHCTATLLACERKVKSPAAAVHNLMLNPDPKLQGARAEGGVPRRGGRRRAPLRHRGRSRGGARRRRRGLRSVLLRARAGQRGPAWCGGSCARWHAGPLETLPPSPELTAGYAADCHAPGLPSGTWRPARFEGSWACLPAGPRPALARLAPLAVTSYIGTQVICLPMRYMHFAAHLPTTWVGLGESSLAFWELCGKATAA